jgi:enoyl-CoA hydratase
MQDHTAHSVHIDKQPHIWTVTLSRPARRNAVDLLTAQALADAFRAFDADPEARVAVLYGDHGTFCAGADLKAISEGHPNRLSEDGDGPMGPSRMFLTKPVIAAISGHAVAGGLELALWCDLRVAEEDAILGVFCRRWGVPLIDGGTVRLPQLIGLSRALDLILTGRPVDAQEALAFGLVNRVVPKGQSLEAAQMLARTLAAFPQECLRADRHSAYVASQLPLAEALRAEFRGAQVLFDQETQHGIAQFNAGQGRHGRF